MTRTDDPEKARRLARALAADLILYNDHKVQSGLIEGNLPEQLAEDLAERRAFYEARVAKDLLAQSNFFDRAVVDVLLQRLEDQTVVQPSWRLALPRLRAQLVSWPACPACEAVLDGSRIVGHRKLDPNAEPAPIWRYLFACPKCLTVSRCDWTAGFASPRAPEVESEGSFVARAKERLAQAAAAGALAAEVESMRVDRDRAWLLGIPELFALATPEIGARRVLKRHVALRDPDPRASSFYPLAELELVPYTVYEEAAELVEHHRGVWKWVQAHDADGSMVHVVLAGAPVAITALRGTQFVTGRPALGRGWRAVDGFVIDEALTAVDERA